MPMPSNTTAGDETTTARDVAMCQVEIILNEEDSDLVDGQRVGFKGVADAVMIIDSSDFLGRQLTGRMDAVLSIVIPGTYIIACLVLFAQHAAEITWKDPYNPNTVVTHKNLNTSDYGRSVGWVGQMQ
jgi:hypothetical protein